MSVTLADVTRYRIVPVVVVNDMYGGDLYSEGRKKHERRGDS